MRFRSRFLLVLAALAFIVPAVSAADFGVRAGRYNDIEETFVGAEVDIPVGGGFSLNPNLEYVLESEVDAGSLNLDVLYRFGRAAVRPYLGGGVGIFRVDTSLGDENTTVVNAIGGLDFNLDFLEPYVQLKYFRSLEDETEGDDVAFVVGLRF